MIASSCSRWRSQANDQIPNPKSQIPNWSLVIGHYPASANLGPAPLLPGDRPSWLARRRTDQYPRSLWRTAGRPLSSVFHRGFRSRTALSPLARWRARRTGLQRTERAPAFRRLRHPHRRPDLCPGPPSLRAHDRCHRLADAECLLLVTDVQPHGDPSHQPAPPRFGNLLPALAREPRFFPKDLGSDWPRRGHIPLHLSRRPSAPGAARPICRLPGTVSPRPPQHRLFRPVRLARPSPGAGDYGCAGGTAGYRYCPGAQRGCSAGHRGRRPPGRTGRATAGTTGRQPPPAAGEHLDDAGDVPRHRRPRMVVQYL